MQFKFVVLMALIAVILGSMAALFIKNDGSEITGNVIEKTTELIPKCNPDYINAGKDFFSNNEVMSYQASCKKACYDSYETPSYRITGTTKDEVACDCDVNDCGRIVTNFCGNEQCNQDESSSLCPEDCPLFVIEQARVDENSELKEILSNKFELIKEEDGLITSPAITIPILFKESAEDVSYSFSCTKNQIITRAEFHQYRPEKWLDLINNDLSIGSYFGYLDADPFVLSNQEKFGTFINKVGTGRIRLLVFVWAYEGIGKYTCKFNIESVSPSYADSIEIEIIRDE